MRIENSGTGFAERDAGKLQVLRRLRELWGLQRLR